jgi:CheY-like chemotaxis protein
VPFEDEPALRTTVTRALQRLGFKVLAAVDGVEGVELFERHRDEIQCVLCDLTMPRMGGWETLAALRQLAPGLPVILCSGYDEARVMQGHHAELPQAFLPKPYTIVALINAINIALAKQEE